MTIKWPKPALQTHHQHVNLDVGALYTTPQITHGPCTLCTSMKQTVKGFPRCYSPKICLPPYSVRSTPKNRLLPVLEIRNVRSSLSPTQQEKPSAVNEILILVNKNHTILRTLVDRTPNTFCHFKNKKIVSQTRFDSPVCQLIAIFNFKVLNVGPGRYYTTTIINCKSYYCIPVQ